MAVTFQIVLFAVQFVRRWFGDAGLLISGAVLGLTDVDALTLSMARGASAGIDPGLAARAITVGVMSNCVMKAILSITLGTKAYGWFNTAALAVMVVAMGVAMVIVR